MTKKKLKFGKVPSLNMPIKSVQSKLKTLRSPPRDRCLPLPKDEPTYSSIDNLKTRIKELKSLKDWTIVEDSDIIVLKHNKEQFLPPFIEVLITVELKYFVIVHGWKMPQSHSIYKTYKTMEDVTVSNLVIFLSSFKI